MKINSIYKKALTGEFLSLEEGLYIYENSCTSELSALANELRLNSQSTENKNTVGWIIDRNVNITNVCISSCKFCNFYRRQDAPDTYITTFEQYKEKIEVLKQYGGDQLLLQGGLHPKLKLDFYKNLFSELKKIAPDVKLHSLGPAEIHHIARLEKQTYNYVLKELIASGLDSLPGAGAEILVERVRKSISRAKCSADEWLDVMREAHKLNITTSATMMFGHIETKSERIEHFIRLREVQSEKPDYSDGFTAFIPWTFQDKDTQLNKESGVQNNVSSDEYVRTVAMARIMMPNIKNIQASWLTVGKETAQTALHAGANDLGSIMIEENVVSAAGANYKLTVQGIKDAIKQAGFIEKRRNQKYEYIY